MTADITIIRRSASDEKRDAEILSASTAFATAAYVSRQGLMADCRYKMYQTDS